MSRLVSETKIIIITKLLLKCDTFFKVPCLKTTYAANMLGPETSVTRLGDILDLGQLFKAFGNN